MQASDLVFRQMCPTNINENRGIEKIRACFISCPLSTCVPRKLGMTSPPADSYRVLVVDDNLGDLVLLQEAARSGGHRYSLVPFVDAKSALDYLQSGNPVHCILTDLNMPMINGIDLLNAARDQTQRDSIPVAIMSSSTKTNLPAHLAAKMNVTFFTKGTTWSDYVRLAREIDGMLKGAVVEGRSGVSAQTLAERMTPAQ